MKISTFGFSFGIWPKAEYFSVFGLRLRLNVKMQLRSFTSRTVQHKREERKETLQTKIDLLNLSVGKTWHFRRALRKYAISLILCSTASCTMGPKFFCSSIYKCLFFIFYLFHLCINEQTKSNWQLPKYGCYEIANTVKLQIHINTSRLEACFRFYRLIIKGKFLCLLTVTF